MLLFTECVSVCDSKYLLIDGEVECYQVWQTLVIVGMVLIILPRCVVFLIGPRLLSVGIINVWQFLSAFFANSILVLLVV